MPTMNKRFKLSALSLALLSTSSMQAYAAEDNSIEQEQDEVEVIEIQGIRGSLAKSINDKRFSKNIADTINAEDIGKNTDQNIADALGRVTGVSIVSRDGEGSQITVRGATSQQNNISLNGQQMTTTDFSQAVDLSTFSSDILSRLEVVKTPSADHDEGSLGGSVNLVTVKPLDIPYTIRNMTLQGRYNDFVDESDYKLQFTVSDKFLDDTLGVVVTAYTETNSTRRDQYRVENFVASETHDVASDQHGNLLSGVRAIEPQNTMYELNQSDTDRKGLTLGVQWLPTDASQVTFDLTYTKQTKETMYDAVLSRKTGGNYKNLVEGEAPLANYPGLIADSTDPQADWYTIDTDTNTFIKKLDRFGAGDIRRSEGGDEQENLNISLKYDLDITDDLRMGIQLGHSNSKSNNLPNAWTAMQNYQQVAGPMLFEVPIDQLQPVGFDCTSGRCEMVTGDQFLGLGEHNDTYTDENGELQPAWNDNTNVVTGYNPADLDSYHLGFISVNDTTVEDTLNNAQIDFDYYLDWGPITSIEFGGKLSRREKLVDNQQYTFTSSTQTEVITDEFGNTIVLPSGPLSGIRGSMIADENGLAYDDFMSSLGYGRSPATRGWTPIDVLEARDLVLDNENTVPNIDNTKTRNTDLDTQAVYFKANFELMDGRLTGDLGVRYVKTEVETQGYAGANFWSHTDFNLEREFDHVKLKELRDTSLPACRPLSSDDPQGYTKKFERVDGLGWDTSSGPDPSGWTRIADQGPCHDPNYASWHTLVTDSIPDSQQELPVMGWDTMWRYADVSTSHINGWGSDVINWDGSAPGARDYVGFLPETITNQRTKSTPAIGSHSYTNVLPSLNLNYAFSDEFVGRFAISKTMTRPEIDQLRPGFALKEGGYWNSGSSFYGSEVDMYNTKLEPLESNNLDVSLEWYFNPTSMLSMAVFHKDMKNFTDINTEITYLTDLREFTGTIDASTITLLADDSLPDSGLTGCMPVRSTADGFRNANDALVLSDDMKDLCQQFQINKVVNGKGAKITGLELGYSQTYDFLPGLLSGLGMSANYTYQNSKYDSDISAVTGEPLPEYPVADTPEHTYNLTTFWEQDGHQIRLSYRGSSDSLVGTDWNTGFRGRTWNQGSIWNEGRDTLDLSLSYQMNEQISFTFQAVNLTDAAYRTYFTSRTLEVQRVYADNANGYDFIALEEGNPLEGDAPKSRTYTEYKVGTTYRLGMRVNF
ncbi:TonB-dependent receptor [Catenovulum sp. 2E275]|uniref:TonB-dependent receptor n=1 Tax=Catenovulum sp. 2E275 TaxID=2980497 RepID=UPI0021D1C348|nr:TonB-dependent receptor [Catenovulum sp. 2E275]MCU4675609.1 TonB-dependent receptor [Catenovulum sp. 2E275]